MITPAQLTCVLECTHNMALYGYYVKITINHGYKLCVLVPTASRARRNISFLLIGHYVLAYSLFLFVWTFPNLGRLDYNPAA